MNKHAVIGKINRRNQQVIAETDSPGNDHGQHVWVLRCLEKNCGNEYGANGSDVFQRKCPRCQGGMPGLDYTIA